MTILGWLDEKESAGVEVSQIALPDDLSFDENPDETIYFKEMKPCGFFRQGNYPFSTVERFENKYLYRGQDKKDDIPSSGMEWRLFIKDKELAVKTAKSCIG
jgi:hypothetical protein